LDLSLSIGVKFDNGNDMLDLDLLINVEVTGSRACLKRRLSVSVLVASTA